MAQGMHLIWMTFCVQLICISSLQTDHGVSKGRLQLTDGSGQKMSHAFSKNPFEFKSHRSLSFSTKLVCALVSKPGSICGHAKAIILQVIVVQTIITYLALAAVYVYVRRKYAKEREEWEKEYDAVPRRFTYKSLYEEATKGFNKDRNDKRKKKKTKTKN